MHTLFKVTKAPTNGSGKFEAIAYDFAAGDADGIPLPVHLLASAVRNFQKRGRPLILRWAHDHKDETAALGTITKVWLDGDKLMISGRFDLESPRAMGIYEQVLRGTINELSIGWTTFEDPAGNEQMELLEVSAVSSGANRGTGFTCAGATCKAASCGCGGTCQTSSAGPGLVRPGTVDAKRATDRWAAKIAAAVGGRSDPVPPGESREALLVRLAVEVPQGFEELVRHEKAAVAERAREQHVAKAIEQAQLPPGAERTRVRVDPGMRPHIEPTEKEREAAELAAWKAERLAAEGPVRVPLAVWSTSRDEQEVALDHYLDPSTGKLVAVDPSRRVPVNEEGVKDGDVVARLPVYALGGADG